MTNSIELEAAVLEVNLNGRSHTIRWPREQSLIDAMIEEGIDVPFSCKVGKCAACACQVVLGEVVMDYNEILTEEDLAEGYILGCQARPLTHAIKVEF